MDRDLKSLVQGVKESKTLERYKEVMVRHKALIVVLALIILFQVFLIWNQYRQFSYYRASYKLNYLSVYNVEQTLTKKSRKKEAMQMVMKVALYYNPDWNERKLAGIAELIYEIGEQMYNIPTEEWILLFTTESEWYWRAVSKAGAKGLGQLMPVTALYLANK